MIPFGKAFLYDRSKGHLLVDILGIGKPKASKEWFVDKHFLNYGNSGLVGELGPGCKGLQGQFLEAKVDAWKLHVGGSLAISFKNGIRKPSWLLAWVGRSCASFGGTALPLDLTFLGAPGCRLYTSLEIYMAVKASGGTFPPVVFPIPKVQALGMTQVYVQALASAPGANGAGLVFSQGIRCLVWPSKRPPDVFDSVAAGSSTAPSGARCYTPNGPVTRFIGSFN